MLDAGPHRVFPCLIVVGIEVFVHGRIGLLNLGMCGAAKVHVQVLGEVPAYAKLTVPQELRVEGEGQFIATHILHIALLQLVVAAL